MAETADRTNRSRLLPYIQAIPDIFRYQLVSKSFLGIMLLALDRVSMLLLKSMGKVAITSGDMLFMFKTVQGLAILTLSLISLFFYVAVDIGTMVYLSDSLLKGEQHRVFESLRACIASLKRLFCPAGIVVVLYISLISPVIGAGLSISLTEGLYIPTFITSVIEETPLFKFLFILRLIVFFLIGFFNLFFMHAFLLDGLNVKEALLRSSQLMRANWKDYLKQNLLFSLRMAVLYAVSALLLMILPMSLGYRVAEGAYPKRFFVLFFITSGAVMLSFVSVLVGSIYMMYLTRLYKQYRGEARPRYPVRKRRLHPLLVFAAVGVYILCGIFRIILNNNFYILSDRSDRPYIIAHRAGGSEGAENTVAGIEKAIRLGAKGSEIDIQRTLDGAYVVNHDSTFERVSGVNRKPEEMTLREVKELSVNGEKVPTLQEMLEASRGRVTLFIELKGATADRQMADDAVRIVKEMGMEDECVFICLKYDLIEYIETTYPEMNTGYLTFISFGDIASLNCDYIGLEEECATGDAISKVHRRGKKALVWTANEEQSQEHFLLTNIDGIITDNISQAMDIDAKLDERSDFEIIIDAFLSSLG